MDGTTRKKTYAAKGRHSVENSLWKRLWTVKTQTT